MKHYLAAIKELNTSIPKSHPEKVEPLLAVLVGNPQGVKAAIQGGADQIYFNWGSLKNKPSFNFNNIKESIALCNKNKVKAILRLTRLVNEKDLDKLGDELLRLKELDWEGVLVGNPGVLNFVRHLGFNKIYGDYTLNIFNDYTIRKLLDYNIVQATLSPELTLEQIKKFSYLGHLPLEVIVAGNFPLMISEHCVVGSILGNKTSCTNCKNACSGIEAGLKDRMNLVFPLQMDNNCRMLVYNSKPLNLYQDLKSILNTGVNVIRIEGCKENEHWIKTVTQIYRKSIDSWLKKGNDLEPSERDWKYSNS